MRRRPAPAAPGCFHREAGDIARRFYRLSDPIGVDDFFEENVLELPGIDEPPEMDWPDCVFWDCEGECDLEDEEEESDDDSVN